MKISVWGDIPRELRDILQQAGHELSDGSPVELRNAQNTDLICARPETLAQLVESTTTRSSRPKRDRPVCGLTFNLKRDSASDTEAEFDAPRTIDAIESAIASFGLDVVRLEATHELPGRLEDAAPDIVFNIAEGWRGRSRESQVPALLEFQGIPTTGSDSIAIGLTLDKALAKRLVAQAGIHTPGFQLITRDDQSISTELSAPLIVKPAAEGSSKGISSKAVARTREEAESIARECLATYNGPVLVEEYVSGREFTVGLIGNRDPVVLPALEVAFKDAAGDFPVYGYEIKQETIDGASLICPAPLDAATRRRLEEWAREVFETLELRDVARIDLRMDAHGDFYFIEVNPLPGLTPGYSDLCLIAEAAAITYNELIGYILEQAMKRHGFADELRPDLPALAPRVRARHVELEGSSNGQA